MNRVTAVLALAPAAVLAACSSAASTVTPPPAVQAAAVAANPVPLLTATGATLEPGEALGSTDIEGDRYASGSYPGGEAITVYTFTTTAAQAADLARNGIPGDDHAIVRAHLANYYLVAVQGQSGGYTFTVTAAQLASRVHGTVDGPATP